MPKSISYISQAEPITKKPTHANTPSIHANTPSTLNGSAPTRCVLYCRVSSKKQVTEGDGLGSQEVSCRNYARVRGYEVLDVFRDGITGGTTVRKGLQELLAFLEKQPPGIVVIIDDIKRFARDVELHFGLKRTIIESGARLESPLFRFEDSPEGKFIETMMAAQAELERNQNKRQVVSRMKARLEQGFWVFAGPPGYTYTRHHLAKKILVPDEHAPLIRETLEGFASGRFNSIADVERFLMERGFYDQNQTFRGSRLTRIKIMLSSVVYSGWIEFLPWGITLRKGYHKGLITYETYARIQERLHQRSTQQTEYVKRHVYPLRSLVLCEGCQRRLTASRSKGRRSKYYDYYHCPNNMCSLYAKGVPQQKIEDDFADLLRPLEMTKEQFVSVAECLKGFSESDAEARIAIQRQLQEELKDINGRIGDLVETISKSRNEIVLQSLESKVEKLDSQRTKIQVRLLEASEHSTIDVGNLLEEVGGLLQNPLQAWKNNDQKVRHLVAKIMFPHPVVYSRETGFGTPELSLPYRVFRLSEEGRSSMVDPGRPSSSPEFIRLVVAEMVQWNHWLKGVEN